ncbi:MAG: TonB-dependent receptor [Muribaculaceae bacterium]|nr:TonB-dependent receptor [Muribaculaceae bacterium]
MIKKARAAGFSLVLMGLILSLLLLPVSAIAQKTSTVSGTVFDEKGEPLIGASVKVANSLVGVATDIDGQFSLQVPSGVKQLTVSYIGYTDKVVDITSPSLTVTLDPDNKTLQEVVVIGYGVQKKNDLTGSVSSVGTKDFNQGVISSPEELINGKVAGVQIVNSGGSPTSGSTIRIRGGASLNASNDPLIVLDGVPIEVGGAVSGSGNFLSLINPNDIENMTILKDASSTAIYGSRASNGVILITTKKGGGDKINVSFQTTNSLSIRTKTSDMLTRDEFIDVVNRRGTDRQKALLGDENTNWNDAIFQTAFGTDNNISVGGRITKWLPFRVSVGAMVQNGILRTDKTQRYTASINFSPSFFNDLLRITLNGKGTYSKNRFPDTNAIWGGATLNPTIPIYNQDGSWGGYNEAVDITGAPVNGAQANPVGRLQQYSSTSNVYRFIGNLDVDYRMHFLPDLRVHATLGYDWSQGKGTVVVPDVAYSYYTTGGRNYVYGPQKNYNRLLTIYANYNKEFPSIKSTLDVTLGYDYQYWKYYSAEFNELNYKGDFISSSAAADQRHTLLSYYGRVNYAFDERYLLTATFRRDGSSRFSQKNRWGTFPSVAIAWRVSREKFFEPITHIMNELKIRASYGVTGQQDGIANYSYIPVYTISQTGAQYQFGGTPIYTYRPEAYNPNLKWETTKSWNVGIDLAFLSNRFTFSADFYTRKTEDLLATVPVAAGVNFDRQMLTNVGNVDSKGVELAISANIIDTKDWSWTATANATWQRSRISNLTLVPGAESPNTGVGPWIDAYQMQVFSTGYAPYAFYLYKQIYDKDGKPIEGLYADLDGDGVTTTNDRYHYHSPAPDWIFGLSTSVRWKKLTLSTSLRANVGNYVFNGMAMNTGAWETMSYNDYQLNNLHHSYLKTGFQKRQYLSDYYVENASFLKMDNIQISYDFGRIANAFNLYASAMVQNVFTITKYSGVDPENASGVDTAVYPRPRTFSITLGLNF